MIHTSVSITITHKRKRRNWWWLLWTLLIAILYQSLTRFLGWTHETHFLQVIINGAVTWVVLSVWFVLTGLIPAFVHLGKGLWSTLFWLAVDAAADILPVLLAGWIFETIMQFTGTSTPEDWWFYLFVAIPHIFCGWELRKQINRYS